MTEQPESVVVVEKHEARTVCKRLEATDRSSNGSISIDLDNSGRRGIGRRSLVSVKKLYIEVAATPRISAFAVVRRFGSCLRMRVHRAVAGINRLRWTWCAFDDFRTACANAKPGDYVALLVDSEDPVADIEKPWEHLKARDSWTKPTAQPTIMPS